MLITRRRLLSLAPAGFAAHVAAGAIAAQEKPPPPAGGAADELYPSLDPQKAREIVGASHAKIDRVRELLSESPALAKAAWDWGYGDWETALGAASHTGRRDIAALLIEHGARPDIFTFAMLGQLDVVRAYVASNPGIQRLHGPHGITLMKHAEAGGEKAEAVVAYLTQLGDADVGQQSVPIPPEWSQRYLGEYSFGPRAQDRFAIITTRDGNLAIRRGPDGSPQRLFHQGEHAFHPTGAPRVVIRFEIVDGAVASLTVSDGANRLRATRG